MEKLQQKSAEEIHSPHLTGRKRAAFSLILLLLIVIIFEGGARLGFVVMGTSLREEKQQFRFWQDVRTDYADNASKLTTHPYLPYINHPRAWPESDEWGIRVYQADDVGASAEEAFTIFAIGGSTTAGPYPQMLYNYLSRNLPEENIRVVNGGIQAWTTAESLINLGLRGLEYDPDMIVIYHAYNDVFPSCAAPFQADYSHWRQPLPTFESVIFDDLPEFFDQSAFFVAIRSLLIGQQRRPRFVLQATTVNLPDFENCTFNGRETFRRNIISMIGIAQAHHIDVMLLTQAHRIQDDTVVREVRHVGEARAHNDILREIATEYDVTFIDFDEIVNPSRAEFIPNDSVHLSREGYAMLARVIGDQIIADYFSAE
ncbi:MAG: hypothetical protein CUN54_05920 [Phototrophicales bacterium]|nr:MAG: hypothetical protein CUN54_05920 [Phototrophicales bacterium]